MITIGEYKNNNGHLPNLPGRIWYEADINYYEGRRNKHRILWSNDGLVMVRCKLECVLGFIMERMRC